MTPEEEITRTFGDMTRALSPRELKKALKSGYRKEANEVKKIISGKVQSSGLGNASKVAKGLRVYIYPSGGGFLVNTVPRGKKGFYRNRHGKEKPVLMWAADGTIPDRMTRRKFKNGKRRRTGGMPNYAFVDKAEPEAQAHVEKNLFTQLEQSCDKAMRKLGL